MIVPLRVVELVSPFLPSTAGRRLLFDSEMLTRDRRRHDAART